MSSPPPNKDPQVRKKVHTLDIGEMIDDAPEGPSTILLKVVAWLSVALSLGEAISEQLIDRPSSPFVGCPRRGKEQRSGTRQQQSHNKAHP